MPKDNQIPQFKIVVLASGRGSNFEAILRYFGLAHSSTSANLASKVSPQQYFANSHASIIPCFKALISDKPSAKALEIAQQAGIPTSVVTSKKSDQSRQIFTENLIAEVQKFDPDLIVLAGFMKVLNAEFIKYFEGKIINIHPSLLPAFKGLHAQRQALQAGVKLAGCTVHRVTKEVDAGEILAQAEVPVLEGDTEETLSARILEQEHLIYPKVIEEIMLSSIR